jgi:hypothetical protein
MQVGDYWGVTNLHHVDLMRAIVPPRRLSVIERSVKDGKVHDQLVDVWLVLVENPDTGRGYRIVFQECGARFALACDGFPSDKHLVVSGWYPDSTSAFLGM